MKKYDLIYYWQNYLINQENMEFKPDAYVLKVSLVNSYSRDYFCNWYSFKCIQELISFIKYVLIPSTYITKVFGKEEDTIFLDALDYYETMELIQDAENIHKLELIKDIKDDYDFIEDLKKKFSIEDLKKFFNMTNERRHGDVGILSKVEFFENVKEIGNNPLLLKRLGTYLSNTLVF